jgi:hypothetical protein
VAIASTDLIFLTVSELGADRHTAATWLMQRGLPIWQAADYLGMPLQMIQVIERAYGHHHPDYMRGAAEAITTKQPKNVSLFIIG